MNLGEIYHTSKTQGTLLRVGGWSERGTNKTVMPKIKDMAGAILLVKVLTTCRVVASSLATAAGGGRQHLS